MDTTATADLAAMLTAHAPSTTSPRDRPALLAAIAADRRCRDTLRQAGLAAAALALLYYLSELRTGSLPTLERASSSSEGALADREPETKRCRGSLFGFGGGSKKKSSSSSMGGFQREGGASTGRGRSGTGYEGENSDGAVVAEGMHAKESLHMALLEEVHCSVVALSHVILQSSYKGTGLPVCTRFFHFLLLLQIQLMSGSSRM